MNNTNVVGCLQSLNYACDEEFYSKIFMKIWKYCTRLLFWKFSVTRYVKSEVTTS
jgi:hypothetical protein